MRLTAFDARSMERRKPETHSTPNAHGGETMSFRLSIIVPDSKLTSTLRQLEGFKVEVETVADMKALPNPDKKQVNGKVAMNAFLSLGVKEPGEGTNYAKMVKHFKKLEVRHGPHKVTRLILRDALKKDVRISEWVSIAGIPQAVQAGYLEVS
jgi:hypothetical protein